MVYENRHELALKELDLDRLVAFMADLEKKRPDIKVMSMKLSPGGRRLRLSGDVPRQWGVNLSFVNFTPRRKTGPDHTKTR